MITFADEVRCVWQRKFTGATVLFFINRYFTLLYRTLMVVQMLPWQTFASEAASDLVRRVCYDLAFISKAQFPPDVSILVLCVAHRF